MSELITDEAIDLAATTYLHMVPHCDGCEKQSKGLLRRCDGCKRLAGEFAAHMLHAAAPLIAGRALREAAERLHERTDGAAGEGTKGWPDRHREVYALAIDEASDALTADADRIESERGGA